MVKPQIVFVDDDAHVLQGLRRMLHARSNTWEMAFLDSSEEAWRLLNEMAIDVLVSDVQMPGMNGLSLLKQVRQDPATENVQVIMMTGMTDRELKREALRLGASDLLTKPIDHEDLVARVESVLRLKQAQDELTAHNRNLEKQVRLRTRELEMSRIELVLLLASAAEQRDEETGNHVMRVGCFSRVIAEGMRLDRVFCETLFLAAPLHDIGKIGIPDAILNKPGPLTDEEWQIMQRHCYIGKEILDGDALAASAMREWQNAYCDLDWDDAPNPVLRMASSIALTHHERWNGTGYPLGLAGEKIPLESRIVALADVYDALSSKRPYKPALPEEAALEIVHHQIGSHFDPLICEAFFASFEKIRAVQKAFAESGARTEQGEVWREAHTVC